MLDSLRKLGTTRILGIAAIVVGIGLLLATPAVIGVNRIESGPTSTMPPEFFPIVAITVLILAGIFLLIPPSASREVRTQTGPPASDGRRSLPVFLVAITVAVFPAAILYIGTYLAVAMFSAAIAIALGERRLFVLVTLIMGVASFVYGLGRTINILFP